MTFPQASLEEITPVGNSALNPFASHLYRVWQEGVPCCNASPTRCVRQEGAHLNMGKKLEESLLEVNVFGIFIFIVRCSLFNQVPLLGLKRKP